MENQDAGSRQPDSRSSGSFAAGTASSRGRQQLPNLRGAIPAVVPALLWCDFGHLSDEVRKLETAGAQALHLDVMDGHFVPNITYGTPIVEAVRRATGLPIEVHLMISDPVRYAKDFFSAGADTVTFHVEATDKARPLVEKLKAAGALAGLAYKPETPLSAIDDCLDVCDLILTMSVSPGFGGQEFQSVALDKLRQLSKQVSPDVLLEVDGGVNDSTIGRCAEAGAQLFVAGSAILGHPDYAQSIATLTHLAQTPSRMQ